MPYLGNSPAGNFASITKDTFSGNGSTTSFTLSKAATTNGVAVYVENVRQIPTTAYSVSGTTLDFGSGNAPVSGTNNIYVMHHNTPVSTATHPSAQDLTAANGTMTGTLSVTGATTVGGTSNLTIADGDLVVGTSGHGISFSATSDGTTMSSELFADYEEGMWNATLAPQSSGSVTVSGGADGCQYTRIGNMVFLSGLVQVNSVSSPTGVLRMSGFPFAVANLDDYGGRTLATINIQAGAIPPNNYGMWINEGDSYGSIYNFTDSEQPQATASNNFSSNESIYFSIMYRTS